MAVIEGEDPANNKVYVIKVTSDGLQHISVDNATIDVSGSSVSITGTVDVSGSTVDVSGSSVSVTGTITNNPSMPSSSSCGFVVVGTAAIQLNASSIGIKKSILVQLSVLDAAASFVLIGNSSGQYIKILTVGAIVPIDFIDNVNKIYVKADAGTASVVTYFCGT